MQDRSAAGAKVAELEDLPDLGSVLIYFAGDCTEAHRDWEPHPEFEDIEGCLRKGILRFTLYGEKLKGGWMLARTNKNRPRPVWTLSKLADPFAETSTDQCVLEVQPNSIKSGKTMEEIVRDWTTPRNKHERQTKLFDEI